MDNLEASVEPFSSENLWKLSKFTLQSLQPLEPFPLDEGFPDVSSGLFKTSLDQFDIDGPQLRELDVFGNDFFESTSLLGTITDASCSSQSGSSDDDDAIGEGEDIWSLEKLGDLPTVEPHLRSWDNVHSRSHRESISPYFSESGPKGFDAALAQQATLSGLENSGRVARNSPFLQALFKSGLGWNSMFFQYDEQSRRFEKKLQDVRISGISLPLLDNSIQPVLQCGAELQRLRRLIRHSFIRSDGSPAMSALASAASVIIYTLETWLLSQFKHINSLLQIVTLFQRTEELVNSVAGMVTAADKNPRDTQVAITISRHVASLSEKFPRLKPLLHGILERVIAPWLNEVECWVGLREQTASIRNVANAQSFVEIEDVQGPGRPVDDPAGVSYSYRPENMPSFVPTEQARQIYESGRSLRLLKRSHPQHPITNEQLMRGVPHPRLTFATTWDDIERIQHSALDYEAKLRAEVIRYNEGNNEGKRTNIDEIVDVPPETTTGNGIGNTVDTTFNLCAIDDPCQTTGVLANPSSMSKDAIGELVIKSNSSELADRELDVGSHGPEILSAIHLSIAPALAAQARLIDFSCLHLLFKEHKIRDHLDLQWRFQLLGDGSFTSRLAHCLFDPEMDSGERKRGVMRSGVHTGLRLGSRDSWPPANSELRLVLIGLLSECHSETDVDGSRESTDSQQGEELPGGLSFAIRELTVQEVVRVKDPNAIEALDFLRLQYKPSQVLETIITPRSLAKYDRLFKHLLRLLRMVSVTKGLMRDSTARGSASGDLRNVFQRFRFDAQHFILALSEYSFQVAVGSAWMRFQDTLARIEERVNRGDVDGVIEAAHSVPGLRDYHEDVLDQIMSASFLSKRHGQVAKLLEETLGTVLAFAPLSRLDGMKGIRSANESTVSQQYLRFRKQVSTFVDYLRGLDGGKASSHPIASSSSALSRNFGASSVTDYLLVRLDMKKYY